MKFLTDAAALGAFALCALSLPALAQTADAPAAAAPAAKHAVAHKKPHAKRAAQPDSQATAAPAAQSPSIVGSGDGSSLERRRRAFFGAKPDDDAPEAETPRAGVTLGGSGGLSPGMGFKF